MKYSAWLTSSENVYLTIYLFILLTPNYVARFPKGGSKTMVIFTHACLFAIIWFFSSHFVWSLANNKNKEEITKFKIDEEIRHGIYHDQIAVMEHQP